MRRVLSVLAGLLVVVAATSAAHAADPKPTQIDFAIVISEGPPPAAGHRFDYQATLSSESVPLAGADVDLLVRPFGSSTFSVARHVVSDAQGAVSASVVLTRTSQVRWAYTGVGPYASTESFAYHQDVGAPVRARAQDTTLRGRQQAVVTGRTDRVKAGMRVTLMRGQVPCFCPGATSVRVAGATVRRDGTFRFAVRFAHPGAKRLFVRVAPGRGTSLGYSRYVVIHVR
ncbi:MAG: hypothetical protein ACJ72E_10125 [Marmoricola sp.]